MDENRVEGMARSIGGKIQGAVGSMTGDTKMQADGAVDRVTGKAQRAYGNAKDTAKDIAGDYGNGLLDTVEEYGDLVADKIDERPITALLIAAGIGLLFALVTKPVQKVVYRRR